MRPVLPPLVIPLAIAFLLPGLSCTTLPEPRWNPSQLTRAVILPVEVAVYRYPGYAYDQTRSSRVSLAVGEAAAAVWRKKGYEVTGPAEAGKTIAADPALEKALISLRKAARSLRVGQGQVNADGERLAEAFSAHLVVLAWGTAEYREEAFATVGPVSLEEKDIMEPREWRNLIKLEYAVLDRGGRPLLYNMEEEFPYSEEAGFLTGNLGVVFSRVPGKL